MREKFREAPPEGELRSKNLRELEVEAEEKGLLPFQEWLVVFQREFYEEQADGGETTEEDEESGNLEPFYRGSELEEAYRNYVSENNAAAVFGHIKGNRERKDEKENNKKDENGEGK